MHTHRETSWTSFLTYFGISLSTQGDSGRESRKKSFRHEGVGGGGGTVGGWGEDGAAAAGAIKGTLRLNFRPFQFAKSARQTINVHSANVKTSLTPIKFFQGHRECMLMLARDQTGPIKYDLKWAGAAAEVWLVRHWCKQPA